MDAQGATTNFTLPGRAGFILPRTKPGFVIGFPNQIASVDAEFQVFRRICDVETDVPRTRVNDATVDPYGGIVFGTFDETEDMEARQPVGSVYRLAPDGTVTKLFGSVVVSNGLAFSPAGDVLYFADTHNGVIQRFAVGQDFSSLVEIDPLALAGAAPGKPDGGITDRDGNYWSARVWGGCVVRFDTSGQITAKIDLPTKGPTCVALGGPALDRLFITTLRVRHTTEELEHTPSAGGVFSVTVDVPGIEQRLCAL
jgi:L-arabinonolactonase